MAGVCNFADSILFLHVIFDVKVLKYNVLFIALIFWSSISL